MGLADKLKSMFKGKSDVFARFELLREAISGTMSKFYKARNRETRQIVGLKVLDKKQTEQLMARFPGLKKPCEGEIAMKMDHPHIVKTFEHGLTTNGEQYLVMEFLEGPGLNSVIMSKDARLDGRRLNLLRQAADALQSVHDAGYIHRDVCPRNFVVDPHLQKLTLIDFGLTVPATPDFQKPGNRTGTPSYMSPEVVRRKPTDKRLDIFSFGVTAYELCTGQLPWEAGKDGQAAIARSSVDPTPVEQYRPTIHPELAKVIMACLSTNADARPQSFADFSRAIRHLTSEDA
ncbi:MAG: serine/threonine protein kinase [Planctomycetales bacterium]|nr:serine/threonine protein kinase [Planctomycetales bacterium]